MKRILFLTLMLVLSIILLVPKVRGYLFWLVTPGELVVSQCYGSVSSGRLAYGVYLPFMGENFRAYHWSGWLAGRANAHMRIKSVLLKSYTKLAETHPDLKFTYGEIS